MNYETNTFGMDVFYCIKATGAPYIKDPIQQVNEEFLQVIQEREKEAAYFLSQFYQEELAALQNEDEENFSAQFDNINEERPFVKRCGMKYEEDDSLQGMKLEETEHTSQDYCRVKYEEYF